MKRTTAIIFLLLFAFTGCEVVTDTNGLPYEDLIVVKGVVQDGQPVDSIYFGHTLPLNIVYNSAQAILSNVSGSIAVDGVQYPLQYTDSGYYNCPGLIGHAGKTYTLDASWNSKHVHGETTVPIPPVIDSVYVIGLIDTLPSFIDTFYRNDTIHFDTTPVIYSFDGALWAHIQSSSGAVLFLNFDYQIPIDSEWSLGTVYEGGEPIYLDTSVSGALWIRGAFDEFSYMKNRKFRADIYSFDPAYFNYERTIYVSQNGNGVFSLGSGQNPDWNISGDGFGIFIGVSEAMKIFTY